MAFPDRSTLSFEVKEEVRRPSWAFNKGCERNKRKEKELLRTKPCAEK
jgi:hypothetical protein